MAFVETVARRSDPPVTSSKAASRIILAAKHSLGARTRKTEKVAKRSRHYPGRGA